MDQNGYSNAYACSDCHAHGVQVWIDVFPASDFYGKCTTCALKARAIKSERKDPPMTMMRTPLESFNEEKPSIAAEGDKAEQLLTRLRPVVIQSPEIQKLFANALAETKGTWKRIDDREKLITRPALESIKSTREFFARPKLQLEALETLLKDKLGEYDTLLANETADAMERAQALATSGDMAGAQAALDTVKGATPPPDGMSVRHPWKFEVINIDLLPREFILPNLKGIEAEKRRQLKAAPDAAPVVPGVKFTRATEIASKSK